MITPVLILASIGQRDHLTYWPRLSSQSWIRSDMYAILRGYTATYHLWLVAFLGVLLMATGAWAHGGGTNRLTLAEAGPYRISVWTQPDPLRVGRSHFSLTVSKPSRPPALAGEAGEPVLDAVVELQLAPIVPPSQSQVVPATHRNAVNKLFYEADVDLPMAGRWQVTVAVKGTDGLGEASFEADIQPPADLGWMIWAILVPVLGAAGWWVFWRPGSWRTTEPVDAR